MKKLLLLTKTLLAAVLLCVGQNAWGDKVIGTVDSNYGTALTGFMTLQKGQSVHYAFTQDTKAEAFYHGFAVAVNKTDGTSLSVIRCDNWENIDNSKSIFTNTFPEGWGSDMASFQSTVLDGATVDMTVTYSAAGIISMASTISNGGNDYTYNYTRSEAYEGTPDQVLVSLVADHAQITLTDWPVPTISVPSTFDFSNAATCSASPFNNCTWVKGSNVNAIRFAEDGNSVTGTAYFDSDAGEDGNQPYTISSNETVTLTINAFHSWINSSKEATVSIKNSAGVELASYKYNPNPGGTNVGKIMDVKIGGTSVTPFEAFDFRSMNNSTAGANGLASGSKPYVAAAANHPVISITIKGDGNVKLKFTRTLAGAVVNQEFSGTLGGDVAKNMASIIVNDGINNSDRAYAIQKLTITSEHPYSVTAIDKDNADLFEIASGMAATGGNITVPFNKYYKTGNSLLQANAIDDSNKQFSYTFAIAASTNAKTIKYNATALNNVVFYAEGEDIASASVVSAGTLNQRGSGRKGAAGTNLVITTLPAGKYKVTVNLGGKKGQAHTVKAGASTIITVSNNSEGENYLGDAALKTITSAEFTLDEPTEITYTGGYATPTATNAQGLDYIYIQEFTDQTATIGTYEYATFSSTYPVNVDVTGLEAYIATGISGDDITMEKVTGNVAANTGLVLKGAANTYSLPVVASGTSYSGTNKLFALDGTFDKVEVAGTGTNYVMVVQDEKVVWAPVTDVDHLAPAPAGHAALWLDGGGARSMGMSFVGDITAVENVDAAPAEAKAKDGKFIENGKLVIVKNGVKFNAAGQQVK